MKLSHEQQAAVDLVLSGESIFLTGKAGTGKSAVIAAIRKAMPCLVTASTGIAARNIEGSTLHSCLNVRALENVECLIVDEVSMCQPALFDKLDLKAREANAPDLPFGGIQLVLVGDPAQLAPVTKEYDAHINRDRFGGCDYFHGNRKLAHLQIIELNQAFRQTDDAFVEALNHVRDGRTDSLALLNSRVGKPSPDALVLCARVATADAINATKLKALLGTQRSYVADIKGNFPVSEYPAPEEIWLKVGARVLVTKNGNGLVNGDVGVVTELLSDSVKVAIDGAGETEIAPVITEYREPGMSYESEPLGTFTQLPLRLGWALTIHKSQGLTLPAIHIDLGSGAFAPGMTYVALSRVRRLADFTLASPLTPRDVRSDPAALGYRHALSPRRKRPWPRLTALRLDTRNAIDLSL